MAGELSVAGQFNYSKLGCAIAKSFNLPVDILTGIVSTSAVQTIGFAAAEQLVLNDVTTPGWVIFHNLDTANSILISNVTIPAAVAPIKLKFGEWAMMRWGDAQIWAKATTANCNLEYVVLPDV